MQITSKRYYFRARREIIKPYSANYAGYIHGGISSQFGIKTGVEEKNNNQT